MTLTTDAPSAAHAAGPPQAPRLRRRPGYAALGAAMVAAGGLAAAWLFGTTTDARPVVVAAADLHRGQVITAGDLATADVAGLTAAGLVPAAAADDLIGRTVALDVPAGLPVPRAAATDQPVPAPGTAVVGVNLPAGRGPGVALHPGDTVRIVGTPRSQDEPPGAGGGVLTFRGAVVEAATDEQGDGGTLVSVAVPAADAAAVAALIATDRVALVLDAPGGS